MDARLIASTNKDLEEEISRGNFREDLFYRLNVIPFYVPPLRERKEDVPLLARHFLREFSAAYGRRAWELTDDAIETLMRYSWPGNVRELRNVIERIVIMNPATSKFDRKHLPALVHRDGSRRSTGTEFSTLHQARDAYERDYILKKLDENHGNVSRTAEVLGLERSHLYRKMKALAIAGQGASDRSKARREGLAYALGAIISFIGFGMAVVVLRAGGADIGPLTKQGVPGFSPIQDNRTYFHYHHTAADTLDKIIPHELAENAGVAAVTAYALANLEQPLPR